MIKIANLLAHFPFPTKALSTVLASTTSNVGIHFNAFAESNSTTRPYTPFNLAAELSNGIKFQLWKIFELSSSSSLGATARLKGVW